MAYVGSYNSKGVYHPANHEIMSPIFCCCNEIVLNKMIFWFYLMSFINYLVIGYWISACEVASIVGCKKLFKKLNIHFKVIVVTGCFGCCYGQ